MKVSSLHFASRHPIAPASPSNAVNLGVMPNPGQQAIAQQADPAIQAEVAQELQQVQAAQGNAQPLVRHGQRRGAIVDIPPQAANAEGVPADVFNRNNPAQGEPAPQQ